MKWAETLSAVLAHLEGDAELIGALGGPHIYRRGAFKAPRVPSIAWTKMGEPLGEVTEPFTIQFDYFAHGIDQALIIERRLFALLHRETWTTLGEIDLTMQYDDDRDHEDPEPGVVHRSLDFRFEPVRR